MKSDMNSRQRISCLFAVMLLASSSTALASAAATPSSSAPKADPTKGAAVAGQVCAACHAADGNSAIPANPILAGQHAAYISKQLHNFKVRPGAKAERENAIMAGFAGALSEDDIRNLAAFYSTQSPKGSYAQNKELALVGQSIYRAGIPSRGVPACVGCHSPSGAGIPAQYPRLSGQHSEYTKTQLTNFRSGQRANSAQMMKISAQLKDSEIEALAEYIAGLR